MLRQRGVWTINITYTHRDTKKANWSQISLNSINNIIFFFFSWGAVWRLWIPATVRLPAAAVPTGIPPTAVATAGVSPTTGLPTTTFGLLPTAPAATAVPPATGIRFQGEHECLRAPGGLWQQPWVHPGCVQFTSGYQAEWPACGDQEPGADEGCRSGWSAVGQHTNQDQDECQWSGVAGHCRSVPHRKRGTRSLAVATESSEWLRTAAWRRWRPSPGLGSAQLGSWPQCGQFEHPVAGAGKCQRQGCPGWIEQQLAVEHPALWRRHRHRYARQLECLWQGAKGTDLGHHRRLRRQCGHQWPEFRWSLPASCAPE